MKFFRYLDQATVILLHKEHFKTKTKNTVKIALQQLSTCKTLRNIYFEMLGKCGANQMKASKEEKYIYYRNLLLNICASDKKQKLNVSIISQRK